MLAHKGHGQLHPLPAQGIGRLQPPGKALVVGPPDHAGAGQRFRAPAKAVVYVGLPGILPFPIGLVREGAEPDRVLNHLQCLREFPSLEKDPHQHVRDRGALGPRSEIREQALGLAVLVPQDEDLRQLLDSRRVIALERKRVPGRCLGLVIAVGAAADHALFHVGPGVPGLRLVALRQPRLRGVEVPELRQEGRLQEPEVGNALLGRRAVRRPLEFDLVHEAKRLEHPMPRREEQDIKIERLGAFPIPQPCRARQSVAAPHPAQLVHRPGGQKARARVGPFLGRRQVLEQLVAIEKKSRPVPFSKQRDIRAGWNPSHPGTRECRRAAIVRPVGGNFRHRPPSVARWPPRASSSPGIRGCSEQGGRGCLGWARPMSQMPCRRLQAIQTRTGNCRQARKMSPSLPSRGAGRRPPRKRTFVPFMGLDGFVSESKPRPPPAA